MINSELRAWLAKKAAEEQRISDGYYARARDFFREGMRRLTDLHERQYAKAAFTQATTFQHHARSHYEMSEMLMSALLPAPAPASGVDAMRDRLMSRWRLTSERAQQVAMDLASLSPAATSGSEADDPPEGNWFNHRSALAKPSSPAGDVRDDEITYPLKGTQLLREFVRQFGSGAQGCEMDCDAVKELCVAITAALSPSTSAAEPVNEPHRFAVVSSDFCRPFLLGAYASFEAAQKAQCGSPEKWPIYERLYAHPAPAAVESAQGVKEQGFVDGYEAAMRDVNVFRVKIAEPFDSSFDTIKVFVFDMLKRNAEKLRASLAKKEAS